MSDDQTNDVQQPSTPQEKAELIARIRQGRAALLELIGDLSDAQMTAPGKDGGWSVKDHLAHLTAWERLAIARLQGRSEREPEIVGMDAASYTTADLGGVNAAIYQRHKDEPLAGVRAAFDTATDEVVAVVDGMTWEDLLRPTFPNDPDSGLLLENVAGNTYDHVAEHTPWIQAVIGVGS
jgi:hypothetical protein